MKKLTIISLIFLSVLLFSQTQSLAYRIPISGNSQIQFDSLSQEKKFKPRPKIIRIFGQEFVGCVIGLGSAFVGGHIGNKLIDDSDHDSFFSEGTLYGIFFGYILGNTVGVYWIGNTDELQGSFGYTFLGSFAGAVAGLYLSGQTNSEIPILVLPGAFGIIAFYLSAEEVVPEKTDALIQIQNDKVQFGAPRIFLTRIDETSNKLRYNFELLRVNF